MEMIEEDGNVSGEDFCIFKFFPSSIYLELCFLLDFPSLRNLMNTCKLLNHKIKTLSSFWKHHVLQDCPFLFPNEDNSQIESDTYFFSLYFGFRNHTVIQKQKFNGGWKLVICGSCCLPISSYIYSCCECKNFNLCSTCYHQKRKPDSEELHGYHDWKRIISFTSPKPYLLLPASYFVKIKYITGKLMLYFPSSLQTTIGELKMLIANKEQYSPDHIKLISPILKKTLQDELTCEECKITKGSTIYLVYNFRGN